MSAAHFRNVQTFQSRDTQSTKTAIGTQMVMLVASFCDQPRVPTLKNQHKLA
jgi:hypothetical protein